MNFFCCCFFKFYNAHIFSEIYLSHWEDFLEASDINQKAMGRKSELKQTLIIPRGMQNFREYTIIKNVKNTAYFATHFF